MATAMESQLQPFNTSNLDDFCSAKTLQKGSKGVVPQGELQGFLGANCFSNSLVNMIL